MSFAQSSKKLGENVSMQNHVCNHYFLSNLTYEILHATYKLQNNILQISLKYYSDSISTVQEWNS